MMLRCTNSALECIQIRKINVNTVTRNGGKIGPESIRFGGTVIQ